MPLDLKDVAIEESENVSQKFIYRLKTGMKAKGEYFDGQGSLK